MATTRDWLASSVRLAKSAGIPPALVLATIEIESGGNPRAIRAEPQLQDSSIGLGQLLFGTARGLGYTGELGNPDSLSGLFSPETNLTFTVKLLADLWRKFGTPARVASAYNGGDRPLLGFGTVTKTPVQICTQRDATGSCIAYRLVPIGEFGNQPHVDKFVKAYTRWYAETVEIEAQDVVPIPTPLMRGEIPELTPLQQQGVNFGEAPLEPPTTPESLTRMSLTSPAIAIGIIATAAAVVYAIARLTH